jgi:hypothetical protein
VPSSRSTRPFGHCGRPAALQIALHTFTTGMHGITAHNLNFEDCSRHFSLLTCAQFHLFLALFRAAHFVSSRVVSAVLARRPQCPLSLVVVSGCEVLIVTHVFQIGFRIVSFICGCVRHTFGHLQKCESILRKRRVPQSVGC